MNDRPSERGPRREYRSPRLRREPVSRRLEDLLDVEENDRGRDTH